jgi:hypothetical protein
MGTVGRDDAQQEPNDEDDLDRLPPLDGDATDAPDAAVTTDDDLAGSDEGEGGLDDSTPASEGQSAAADAAELADSIATDRGWVDEASDNPMLDIGGYDLVHGTLDRAAEKQGRAGEGAQDLDEPDGHPAPDDDFAAGERDDALDPAAEDGPVDADEELREEDLPALDADEHDSGGDDVALLDERLARGESSEPVGVPWSAAPWVRVGAPVGLRSVTALACVPRGALVAWRPEGRGSTLLLVDLEGTRQTVRADGLGSGVVRRIAAQATVVAAVLHGSGSNALENGRLWLSHNIAENFETPGIDVDALQIAFGSERLWVATRSGGLASLAIGASRAAAGALAPSATAIEHHDVPGKVRALASDGAGGIVALSVDAAERPAALVRGGADGSIRWEGIELPAAPSAGTRPARGAVVFEPLVAARGSFAAIGLGAEVLHRGAGGAWQRASWDGSVTAMAFVDEQGTLLAATYSQVDAATALISVAPSGRPAVVALVGASPDDPDSDGRATAIACDDAHGVVWLAGGFGFAAFAKPSKV